MSHSGALPGEAAPVTLSRPNQVSIVALDSAVFDAYNNCNMIKSKAALRIGRSLEVAVIRTICVLVASAAALAAIAFAADSPDAPAPTVDRVGFPKGYQDKYAVLRTVNKPDNAQIVTVYGNEQAASITRTDQLPYPYGSIIVMETATATKDSQGKPIVDKNGAFRPREGSWAPCHAPGAGLR